MKDPTLGPELERVMDQAVGIGLGMEPPPVVDDRLRVLASAQGTRWDIEAGEPSPVLETLAAPQVRSAGCRVRKACRSRRACFWLLCACFQWQLVPSRRPPVATARRQKAHRPGPSSQHWMVDEHAESGRGHKGRPGNRRRHWARCDEREHQGY